MLRKRTYKSGFRTFEMDALYYKSEFFRRFIRSYPQAIDELIEMLPLFQTIFGPAVDIDVMEHLRLFETSRFDRCFLMQPDEMLPRCNDNFTDYKMETFRREPKMPDFIRMPDDHPYKGNEGYYKRKVETSLVWSIAELRSEAGDTDLLNILNNFQEQKDKIKEESIRLVQKFYEEQSQEFTERDVSVSAYQLTDKLLDDYNLYPYESIEPFIKNFWIFYERFHDWIAKYYLYRSWLRRSFFIALRRGLSSFWADVGSPVYAPASLKAEFYGIDQNERDYFYSDIPSPESFHFKIIRYVPEQKEPVATDEKWQAEAFSLFHTPVEYAENVLDKFRAAIEKMKFFGAETELVERFTTSVRESAQDYSESSDVLQQEFTKHLRQFPLFKSISDNRAQVQRDFENHIQKYLDRILPIIGKHLRTKTGAPPKFDRINWLLDWNIDNLTAREIVEKYELSDESTFWKALDDLKIYNLPIKEKLSDQINWNDEWFIERMKAGFPDLKKLEKNSGEKK